MKLKEYIKQNNSNLHKFAKQAKLSYATAWRIYNEQGETSPKNAEIVEIATNGAVTRMELLYPEEQSFSS